MIPKVENPVVVASATSLLAVQPQETLVPSSGLVLSTPSPFKAVAAHQHRLKEKEQTEGTEQQKAKQATAMVSLPIHLSVVLSVLPFICPTVWVYPFVSV